MRLVTFLLLVPSAIALVLACGAAPPAATPSSASADEGQPSQRPKLCGCSLCEPLVSDDPCSADSDCAPSAACHADRCIAKAKAPKRDPQTMCTMMMACHSVDANRCGCHEGKCALIPR